MYYAQQRIFSLLIGITLALACIQLLNVPLTLQAQAASVTTQAPQSCGAACRGTFFGSNHAWMLTATQDWYQHGDFWCGIANIHAIQVYDWLYYDRGKPRWDNSQEAIYNRLNNRSSAGTISPWGYGGGYVRADISRDTGTDPRAIAFGAWYETPPGSSTNINNSYLFHNWIYNTTSTTATYDFSTDFGVKTVSHNDPISVTVDRGGHSFVVDGVFASNDPSVRHPTLYGIDTWDPWLNRSNQPRIRGIRYNTFQNQVWSLTDWTTNPVLWGQPYSTNYGNDPDPTKPPLASNYYVAPFHYNVGPAHHWLGQYVTIEQDRVANVNVNYALNQLGRVAAHN